MECWERLIASGLGGVYGLSCAQIFIEASGWSLGVEMPGLAGSIFLVL
jgi:hypothetical protein